MVQKQKHVYQFEPDVQVIKKVKVKFEQVSETVVRRFSSKQVFLKISQILQENNCVGDTFS